LREEMTELEATVDQGDAAGRQEEVGDLLFTVASLARHLQVDPEEALRRANRKFEDRFRIVEEAVRKSGRQWAEFNADALDTLWREAKRRS
ncbi:MAG: nucleoside triphosphate pyrophosphohydrolase, partial [Gammaproteobacteria bacterium]|nr:nucleoside triphosphate pyrophosphohydrolase [Gammaproteobacteria bacterium]